MKALLDTHAYLWWLIEPELLSPVARDILLDKDNQLVFSVVSGWEIAIKAHMGKLELPGDPEHLIPHHLRLDGIEIIPVQLSHALHTYHLPDHHRDPFDRLLVAQAQLERLPVITADPLLTRYDIQILW